MADMMSALMVIFILFVLYMLYGLYKTAMIGEAEPLILAQIMNKNPDFTSIDLYEYRNQRVILVTLPCCDRKSNLYDLNGQEIGHPTGGLSGKGDGRMLDWALGAKFIKNLRAQKTTI